MARNEHGNRTVAGGMVAAQTLGAIVALGGPGVASADDGLALNAPTGGFTYASASQPEPQAEKPAEPAKRFGDAGSKWWTLGAGAAYDFSDYEIGDLNFSWSYFLAKDVEFNVEGAILYFNQPGNNAVGFSPSMIFRWHFINKGDWTVFADLGIGVMVASDEVPSGGTQFDFTPRAGAGVTYALTEDLRLQVGLRWFHVSNARINGDDNNPAIDAPMLYAGLIWPF